MGLEFNRNDGKEDVHRRGRQQGKFASRAIFLLSSVESSLTDGSLLHCPRCSLLYSLSVQHNTAEDCWIILNVKDSSGDEVLKVVDVSKYLALHPGGSEVIVEYAGADASSMFEDIGHSNDARAIMTEYVIGDVFIDPSKPKPKKAEIKSGSGALDMRAVVLVLIAIVVGYYYSNY